MDRPYHRRFSGDSQAFAVRVGAEWAGSIGVIERTNRDFLLGLRQQLPPILAQLFPYPLATLGRDFHVVAVLHEVFHAYQAMQAPTRFASAQAGYSAQDRYPCNDAGFAAAWDKEGGLLAAALKAADDGEARGFGRRFLQARESRRAEAALDPTLLAFERGLEWLEGLAKYAEIRFYELAASSTSHVGPNSIRYRSGLPYWQGEFKRLDGGLSREDGDYRFYLSGMAQARLLDRLSPDWKREAMRDGVYLEDVLRRAVGL